VSSISSSSRVADAHGRGSAAEMALAPEVRHEQQLACPQAQPGGFVGQGRATGDGAGHTEKIIGTSSMRIGTS
jgi:hypothetical protein